MRAQPVFRIETERVRSLIAARKSLIHRQTAGIAHLPVNAGHRLFQRDVRKNRKSSVADAVARAQQSIVVVSSADVESGAQIVRPLHFRNEIEGRSGTAEQRWNPR